MAIQYRSTASSAAKSTATVTDGGRHVNCSRNSRSGPISLSREKTTWKDPAESAAQRDASTDTTAVHFRSSVDGCISENWTSANAKVGPHACWAAACVTQMRGIAAARNAGMQDRFMGGFLAVDLRQSPRRRGGGLLHPEYRGRCQSGVRAKTAGDCDKESDRAKIEPIRGDQCGARARDQADRVGCAQ